MTVDKIYYTDGHEVTVSDSALTVKKKQYRLMGITKHELSVLRPVRAHGWSLVVTGLFFSTIGAMNRMPPDFVSEVRIFNWVLGPNTITVISGLLLALVGFAVVSLRKPRYAVHISTAEGEADVLVSPQREYIKQIVEALNRAFMGLKAK